MSDKKEILNQINSFKNRIIKGNSKSKQSLKNNGNNTIHNKIDINLIYVNNFGNQQSRNTTAPNKKRIKDNNNNHLKITAKNREIQNLYIDKALSKKISERSLPKNVKISKNINKSNKRNTFKRVNSSNNIKAIENNAIDYFTQKLEGSKTNIINKFQNNIIYDIKSNIINEFKIDNFSTNNQIGLFNINLHSNMKNFDDISFNKNKAKLSVNDKTPKNKENNSIKNLNQKKNFNPIMNNGNLYKVRHSSSIDPELNKLIQKSNKEIKKSNIIYEEYKLMKSNKNNSKYNHVLENEKSELEKNNKNNKKLLNKNENNIKNKNNLYQYLILKGNASYLVKYCMYHRTNWVEAYNPEPENPDYSSNIFNFKWKELSYGIDYYNLNKDPKMKQIVNHFEYHFVISNKAYMFINMMKYCEKRNLSVFKYVPFTIVFKIKDRRKIKNKEKQRRWNEKLDKLKKFIQGIDKNVKNYENIGNYYTNEEYILDREKRDEFEQMKQIKKNEKKSKEEEKDSKGKEKANEEKYIGKFEVYSDVFPRLKPTDKVSKKNKLNDDKEKEIKYNRIIGSNTLIEIPHTHYNGKNMWVIKAINLNRGMCIRVVNSFEQMEKVINKFKTGVDYSNFTIEKIEEEQNENINDNNNQEILIEDKSNDINSKNPEQIQNKEIEEKNINEKENQNNQIKEQINNNKEKDNNKEKESECEKEEKIYNCNKIIIQKYIENPLLYKGRKCDMRIWVLLTHQKKVYLFKEGHLKTCSVEYDINSKDAFTHITNYSFQKHNTNFQKFEKGNEVPFYEFQKFIDEKYPEKNYKLNRDLMKQIKEIIAISMRCGKNKINKNNRSFQFEIFGYDFMLDSDFNAFLIEINTNPGLEISSPWIQIVVPRMLDDALRLTVDKVFEPNYDFNKNYKGDYTEQQKKLLIDSKIKYDFNAVDPININLSKEDDKENKDNKEKKDVSSLTSSTLSKVSQPSSITKSNNIFDINLELDDFDKKLLKEETINENNKISNIDIKEIKEEDKNNSNSNKIIEENKDANININKNHKLKYISPFPVPGYSLDENLWDFICDLNEKDPYDITNDKDNKDNKDNNGQKNSFTGIRHLLKKRTNKPKKEKNKK